MTTEQRVQEVIPEQDVLVFSLNNQRFNVRRRMLPDNMQAYLTTYNEQGVAVGSILGKYEKMRGHTFFTSMIIGNLQRSELGDHTPDYVPHVVGATIAELLVQEHVDVWFSDRAPSLSARRMYIGYLAKKPELTVSQTGVLSYMVARAGYVVFDTFHV